MQFFTFKTITKKHKILLISLLFFVLFSGAIKVLATYPTTPFSASDHELNPDCGPTDPNCYVDVASGTGITSLGGLTGDTQTFATGAGGSDFNIDSTGTTHTFNLPTASASNRGLLSTADWSTFNGKLSSVSLAQNQIAFGNGSNVMTSSANLTWDGDIFHIISSSVSGNHNTFINGGTSLVGSWIQGNNIAIGVDESAALNNLTTNNVAYTVAVGASAGSTVTSGSNNTFLGAFTDVTTGTESNSVALGRNAIITASNQFVVGGTSGNAVPNWKINNVDYTWPGSQAGGANYALVNNGSGALSWAANSGLSQADTDTDGFLSSTDWNTFNGKANTSDLLIGSTSTINGETWLGEGAGSGVTPSLSSYMVFLGYHAGDSATSAAESSFIGAFAGRNATNDYRSQFIGRNAGENTSNANNSIFIGDSAGTNDAVNNSGGHSSILIGDSTSTGGFSDSIGLGQEALNTMSNQFLVAPSYTNWQIAGVDYVWPGSQAGGANYALINDGSGGLSWAANGGLSQAAGSTDGFLLSTDWNTFNNKQDAGAYLTNIALTQNQIAFGDGSDLMTSSSNFIYDPSGVNGVLKTLGITDGFTHLLADADNSIYYLGTNGETTLTEKGTSGSHMFVDDGNVSGGLVVGGNGLVVTDTMTVVGNFGLNGGNNTGILINDTDTTILISAINGITLTGGPINFNAAYTFPTSDGGAGQVLTTDGSGALSFEDIAALGNTITVDSTYNNIFSGTIGAGAALDGAGGGTGNIFLGEGAGDGVTTGTENVFIGRGAGGDNITGSFNVFVGPLVGVNATGASNSFFGYGAGHETLGSSYNSFFGQSAGYYNTTGLSNSFFGTSAGGHNATGSQLTLIGSSSGTWDGVAHVDGLVNATALGYNAQVTQSNSLILGGTGSGAVKVGIGLTAPTYTFDVSNTATAGIIGAFTNSDGTCTLDPGDVTGWSCPSDERLKKDILTFDDSAIPLIDQLRVVTYRLKNEDESISISTGLIAQEVEGVFPKLVKTQIDGTLSLNYGGLTPYMIKAIQELDIEIKDITDFANEGNGLFAAFREWFASATNGIMALFVHEVHTDTLCVGNTCVTESQLQQLLQNQNSIPHQENNNENIPPVSDPVVDAPPVTDIPTPSETNTPPQEDTVPIEEVTPPTVEEVSPVPDDPVSISASQTPDTQESPPASEGDPVI